MRLQFNNVDFTSRSGPNGFGKKLAIQLSKMGHFIVQQDPEVVLNFIQGFLPGTKNVLRLDGIYFNTAQNWQQMNEPIKKSYDLANDVIVQSNFDRELIFRFFGERERIQVIHNGTDRHAISSIPTAQTGIPRENLWCCASAWRPHKRLTENIRYFQEFAGPNDVLAIAGSGDISVINSCVDSRVKWAGDLSWEQLISLMKASSKFIHLAFLDHCPNVVVDARAAGCQIVCASSGGTKEIAGSSATVVKDIDWDFLPFELYSPPQLNFSIQTPGDEFEPEMERCAKLYEKVLIS